MLLVSEVRTRAHSCDGMPQLRGRCREMMMGHEVDDPFTWVELDALVSDLLEVRREIAAAEARQARILSAAVDLVADRTAALHRRDPGRLAGADLPLREVCAELAAATRMSDRAVQRRMGDAASVVKDYPQVLEAWSAGHIDAGHVTAILDAGIGMDAGTRAEYEQVVLDAATHETAGRMRTIARTIAARVDPDGEARRTATARADRYIRVIDLPDGMARLLADLPATLAHAIYDRLTGMARTILDDHDRHRAVAESVDAGMASGAGDPAAAADAGPTAPAPAGDPPAAADPAPAASPTPAAPAGSAASATPGDPAVPAIPALPAPASPPEPHASSPAPRLSTGGAWTTSAPTCSPICCWPRPPLRTATGWTRSPATCKSPSPPSPSPAPATNPLSWPDTGQSTPTPPDGSPPAHPAGIASSPTLTPGPCSPSTGTAPARTSSGTSEFETNDADTPGVPATLAAATSITPATPPTADPPRPTTSPTSADATTR